MEQEQVAIPAAKQLKVAAAEEKRLLRGEAAAEKKVIKARARLAKAEGTLNDARARFERRAKDVAEAEAELRNRQTARANGPVRGEPSEAEPVANEPAGSAADSGS